MEIFVQGMGAKYSTEMIAKDVENLKNCFRRCIIMNRRHGKWNNAYWGTRGRTKGSGKDALRLAKAGKIGRASCRERV